MNSECREATLKALDANRERIDAVEERALENTMRDIGWSEKTHDACNAQLAELYRSRCSLLESLWIDAVTELDRAGVSAK